MLFLLGQLDISGHGIAVMPFVRLYKYKVAVICATFDYCLGPRGQFVASCDDYLQSVTVWHTVPCMCIIEKHLLVIFIGFYLNLIVRDRIMSRRKVQIKYTALTD